jgi:hypothetical protein
MTVPIAHALAASPPAVALSGKGTMCRSHFRFPAVAAASGTMGTTPANDVAATTTTPIHGDAIKTHKAKISLLSRELANLTQERDLLLEFVLGGSGASSLPPQELVHQLFSGRQAHLRTSHTMTSSLPTSLGVITPQQRTKQFIASSCKWVVGVRRKLRIRGC